MSFFDEPAKAPPTPPDYRMPAWLGPSENVLPTTVALNLVLTRRPDLAI